MTAEQWPQLFKAEEAPEKKEGPQSFHETSEDVEKKLKEAGAKKEDIEVALRIMKEIGFLDRAVFPGNPAAFNFVVREDFDGHQIGFLGKKSEKKKAYQIVLKNLAEYFEREVSADRAFFDKEGRLSSKKNRFYGLAIAAHEVRHRVQLDPLIRKFSPESAKLVKDNILRFVIEFQEILFQENEKIYRKEQKSKKFMKRRLGPKEFDAEVIERFVGNKLNEVYEKQDRKLGPSDLNEIVSIIQMSGPEKKD